jgi:hypothetical protein
VLALADGQPPTPQLARALQAAAMVEVSLTPTAATVDMARRSQELFERFGDRQGAAFSKLLRTLRSPELLETDRFRIRPLTFHNLAKDYEVLLLATSSSTSAWHSSPGRHQHARSLPASSWRTASTSSGCSASRWR